MISIVPKSSAIRAKRVKNGLSLRDLANKSKVHYSTISNIENSKGSTTPHTAKLLCDALKLDFDELFEIVET